MAKFSKSFGKAILAYKNSGYEIIDDFAEVSKIAEAGAASKPVVDFMLSHYAYYLIVQNGDPRTVFGFSVSLIFGFRRF